MAGSGQEASSQGSFQGGQSLSDLLRASAGQLQEAFFDGNPIAVAAIGVVSFLLLTVAAQCTYFLRSSVPVTKKSTRRRRKVGGGPGTTSPDSTEASQVSMKPTKPKGGSQIVAASIITAVPSGEPPRLAEAHQPEDDGGGEWLLVSKKKSKPKKT